MTEHKHTEHKHTEPKPHEPKNAEQKPAEAQAKIQDFSGFGLPAGLLKSLARIKFTTPTPIQAKAIPIALQKKDILGTAQTGTGKTGAFGIPLIARLMENPQMTALVLTPTRELAAQVMATMQQMIPGPDIKTALLIGGEAMPRQFRQLQNHPRLIVGTPGRVNDHLTRGTLKLDHTGILVLDETDRMLDLGFGVQIETIVKPLPPHQTLLFSATMPQGIIKLAHKYLHNPERIAIGDAHVAGVNISQETIHTPEGEKYTHLLAQLQKREGSVIIFVRTKFGTERLAQRLCKENHRADAIHGDLQQRRRDRVIRGFRDKEYRILVATDVAARGLDIPHIEHVINYDLPQCPEDYIHRIGRTARAGAKGSALSLIIPGESGKWRAIQNLMNPGSAPAGGSSDNRNHNRNSNRRPPSRDGKPANDGFNRRKRFGGGPKKTVAR